MSGSRRALLLGATARDLLGVRNDIALMREALGRHGFEVSEIVPATRARIEAGLAELISTTTADDAVVVYYSGHGADVGELPRAGGGPLHENSFFRMLLPSDIEETCKGDFRGYTNIEFSLALMEFSQRTKNVTVILDCCYSGGLTRAPGAVEIKWQTSETRRIRGIDLPEGFVDHAAAHYEWLGANCGVSMAKRDPEANPDVVRIFACGPQQVAAEVPHRGRGGNVGALTRAVHHVLMQVDLRFTTWRSFGYMIRSCSSWPADQSPAIEGPDRRYLFELDERQIDESVPVDMSKGELKLVGGMLTGQAPDDLYELYTYEMVRPRREQSLGQARIVETSTVDSTLETEVTPSSPPAGCWARLVRHSAPRVAVELTGESRRSDRARAVVARIEQPRLVRVVERCEDHDLPVAARLEFADDRVQLKARGIGYDYPAALDPSAAPREFEQRVLHIADNVQLLGRIELMLTLPEGTLETDDWALSCSRVSESTRKTLPRTGAVLAQDDRITVQLRAHGPTRYLTVLLVHPHGRIELLSRAYATGVPVVPGRAYALGQRSGGPIEGKRIIRPTGSVIPREGRVPLDLIAFVSSAPIDLRSWCQDGLRRFQPKSGVSRGMDSKREVEAESSIPEATKYRILRYQFELD